MRIKRIIAFHYSGEGQREGIIQFYDKTPEGQERFLENIDEQSRDAEDMALCIYVYKNSEGKVQCHSELVENNPRSIKEFERKCMPLHRQKMSSDDVMAIFRSRWLGIIEKFVMKFLLKKIPIISVGIKALGELNSEEKQALIELVKNLRLLFRELYEKLKECAEYIVEVCDEIEEWWEGNTDKQC